jgi:hypothetical protein
VNSKEDIGRLGSPYYSEPSRVFKGPKIRARLVLESI